MHKFFVVDMENPLTTRQIKIIESIACDNLSASEAALVFKCSEKYANDAINLAMHKTGLNEKDLWQIFGVPQIHLIKSKNQVKQRKADLDKLIQTREDTLRRKPWLLVSSS